MSLRAKRGFTLIELLVVVAIIGILAALIVVNLSKARVKARDSKRMSDIQTLATALGMYEDDNGPYKGPDGKAGVHETCYVGDAGCLTELTTGGYVASLPPQPSGGKSTKYTVETSNGTSTTPGYIWFVPEDSSKAGKGAYTGISGGWGSFCGSTRYCVSY